MVRQHAGPSQRSRNRITNKTSLKVVEGNIDAEPIVHEEDEDRTRGVSTAGVDAEDANEHHLQAVLNAASQRATGALVAAATLAAHAAAASQDTSRPLQSTAHIPVPDATGVAANHQELYPPHKWRDPHHYTQSSLTVEENVAFGTIGDSTYYMDEVDELWLTKNNQEARGEGTSMLAAVQSPGTTTRQSQRSAKARGKEPDVQSPLLLKEDEFELVMGLFEKWTQDKAEFLHHGFEDGESIPPFADYQDMFSMPLVNTIFPTFEPPEWLPESDTLVRMARLIYPHWRDRRIERKGKRIIPYLNFDEADTANEAYICFRRREIKAVRKTRAAQASPSEKLHRLANELSNALTLTSTVLSREERKREQAREAQLIWTRRMTMVDLKRRFPSIMTKDEEEMLVDKKPRINPPPTIKVPKMPNASNSAPEYFSPKARMSIINNHMDHFLAGIRSKDKWWEDGIDNPYQQRPVAYTSRMFKYLSPSLSEISRPSSPDSESTEGSQSNLFRIQQPQPQPSPQHQPQQREPRAFRLRFGRGGRMLLDRRLAPRRKRVLRASSEETDQDQDMDQDAADERERQWRLQDRWRYDEDDGPAHGPEGPEADDRVLIDDMDTKYARHSVKLYQAEDWQALQTDTTVLLNGPNGTRVPFKPFGGSSNMFQRGAYPGFQRAHAPSVMQAGAQAAVAQMRHPSMSPSTTTPTSALPGVNGPGSGNGKGIATAVSMQHQMRKMQPPPVPPQIRVSSNPGAVGRSPSTNSSPVATNGHASSSPVTMNGSQPPSNVGDHTRSHSAGVNGKSGSPVNGSAEHPSVDSPALNHTSPVRPKSQTPHPMQYPTMQLPNGFVGAGGGAAGYNGFPTNGLPVSNAQMYMNHPSVGQNGGITVSAQQQLHINQAIAATIANNNANASQKMQQGNYQLHPNIAAAAAAAQGGRAQQMMYAGMPNGLNAASMNFQFGAQNMSLKLPNGRPQWRQNVAAMQQANANAAAAGNMPSGVPGVDLSAMNGFTSAQMQAAVASANGMGRASSTDGSVGQHLSPNMHAAGLAQGRISPLGMGVGVGGMGMGVGVGMGGSPHMQAASASPQMHHSPPHHHASPAMAAAQPHSQTPVSSPQRPMVPGSGAGY